MFGRVDTDVETNKRSEGKVFRNEVLQNEINPVGFFSSLKCLYKSIQYIRHPLCINLYTS